MDPHVFNFADNEPTEMCHGHVVLLVHLSTAAAKAGHGKGRGVKPLHEVLPFCYGGSM